MSVRKPMLSCEAISFEVDGNSLLRDISFDITAGELIGLIGPNGAGKSTLLSLIASLNKPDSGVIRFDQQPLNKVPLSVRSRRIAWVEQGGSVHWPLSVERIVALGRRPHLGDWQRLADEDLTVVESVLQATSCNEIRTQPANTLSGGEKARMLLARALAASPELLLADEPIAALDPAYQLQMMSLLKQFTINSQFARHNAGKSHVADNQVIAKYPGAAGNHRACVVVLHDLSLALRFCDRLLLLHQGELVAAGFPDQVLSDDNLRQVYGISVLRGEQGFPWLVPAHVAGQTIPGQ